MKKAKIIKHFPSKLENKARELLRAAPRQLQAKQIAEATGLSDSWLSEFAKGELKGASAGRLEALISYLDKPFEI
jgi:predicted XRE-type DNA-binding protein